jgi:hypothetical protein
VTNCLRGDFRKSDADDQQPSSSRFEDQAIVYLGTSAADHGKRRRAVLHVQKAVVVRSGRTGTGAWITETRNVYDDYRRLFHEEPGEVNGVRLQINSQYTGTSAESFFADVVFQKQ